ncbi:hypothetical protein SDC9_80383 [bioreactor metagenome]|uniref:Uncharacterized protein n=1 Tax=bioreactor metagenome TaxID=1076179 RepID=A0A644Z6T4_9ZZZZ|nr:hypothetical protein [Candidatus Metalachnospira sp.]
MIKHRIINDTVLVINNIKEINFNHNINKVIENNGLLILHIFDCFEKKGSINMSEQPINNIYAVSEKGDIVWNIRDIMQEDYCYTGISIDDKGNLIANTFIGIAQIIDVTNKKLIGRKVTK